MQACCYTACMTAITIRDVPGPILENLKQKAAQSGKSLQSFLLDVISREAKTVPVAELMEQLEREAHVTLSTDEILDAVAGGRERRW